MFSESRKPFPRSEGFIATTLAELSKYTEPVLTPIEESALLDTFELATGKHFGRSFVVGRFQPLHYGHVLLMKYAARISDSVVVGIGSANVTDWDNPFSVGIRRKMIEGVLESDSELREKVEKVVTINDFHDDQLWFDETKRRVGLNTPVDVVVGNNDWVNDIFIERDIPAFKTPLFDRGSKQGVVIRRDMREQQEFDRSMH